MNRCVWCGGSLVWDDAMGFSAFACWVDEDRLDYNNRADTCPDEPHVEDGAVGEPHFRAVMAVLA